MEHPGVDPPGRRHALAPQRLDPPSDDGLADRLFPPLPTEVEWGLDRTRALLAELGDPHRSWPSLHVGGTNGKGTVAAVCAAVLAASGRRVGLYTSPHLCSFAERFQIDGRPVSGERLLDTADGIRAAVVRHGLTFFEASTVLAFEHFRREAVDVAVVEVGLGGRLDATNVLRPAVSVVTNVARDHADWLGETLEEIAGEKAGIAKEDVPLVTAEADPELLALFRRAARRAGAPFRHLEPARAIRDLASGTEGSRFRMETGAWGELALESPLVGRHQAVNVALVLFCLTVTAQTDISLGAPDPRWQVFGVYGDGLGKLVDSFLEFALVKQGQASLREGGGGKWLAERGYWRFDLILRRRLRRCLFSLNTHLGHR
jgi:folylpolyglutamate synthase/dihydropteroate synthase